MAYAGCSWYCSLVWNRYLAQPHLGVHRNVVAGEVHEVVSPVDRLDVKPLLNRRFKLGRIHADKPNFAMASHHLFQRVVFGTLR